MTIVPSDKLSELGIGFMAVPVGLALPPEMAAIQDTEQVVSEVVEVQHELLVKLKARLDDGFEVITAWNGINGIVQEVVLLLYKWERNKSRDAK